jgi:hypothetical protein
MVWRVLAAMAVLGFATDAAAQERAPDAPPAERRAGTPPDAFDLGEIVVDGQLRQRVEQFVETVSRAPAGRGLARWAGPVCIGVVNFRRAAAEQIADRLVAIGDEIGVPIEGGACEPDIYVVGAVNGRAVATEWVELRPADFRPAGVTRTTAGRAALDLFMTSEAPVRWWQISVPVYYNIFTGRAAPTIGPGAEPIYVFAKSQLRSRTRDDLKRIIIIVDVEQLAGATTEQLCAYLSMVAFSQISADTDTRAFDTILNLFSLPEAPGGLTDWDRAYLFALYNADESRRVDEDDQADRLLSTLREGAAPDAR